jgi:hypothetical protein
MTGGALTYTFVTSRFVEANLSNFFIIDLVETSNDLLQVCELRCGCERLSAISHRRLMVSGQRSEREELA